MSNFILQYNLSVAAFPAGFGGTPPATLHQTNNVYYQVHLEQSCLKRELTCVVLRVVLALVSRTESE